MQKRERERERQRERDRAIKFISCIGMNPKRWMNHSSSWNGNEKFTLNQYNEEESKGKLVGECALKHILPA